MSYAERIIQKCPLAARCGLTAAKDTAAIGDSLSALLFDSSCDILTVIVEVFNAISSVIPYTNDESVASKQLLITLEALPGSALEVAPEIRQTKTAAFNASCNSFTRSPLFSAAARSFSPNAADLLVQTAVSRLIAVGSPDADVLRAHIAEGVDLFATLMSQTTTRDALLRCPRLLTPPAAAFMGGVPLSPFLFPATQIMLSKSGLVEDTAAVAGALDRIFGMAASGGLGEPLVAALEAILPHCTFFSERRTVTSKADVPMQMIVALATAVARSLVPALLRPSQTPPFTPEPADADAAQLADLTLSQRVLRIAVLLNAFGPACALEALKHTEQGIAHARAHPENISAEDAEAQKRQQRLLKNALGIFPDPSDPSGERDSRPIPGSPAAAANAVMPVIEFVSATARLLSAWPRDALTRLVRGEGGLVAVQGVASALELLLAASDTVENLFEARTKRSIGMCRWLMAMSNPEIVPIFAVRRDAFTAFAHIVLCPSAFKVLQSANISVLETMFAFFSACDAPHGASIYDIHMMNSIGCEVGKTAIAGGSTVEFAERVQAAAAALAEGRVESMEAAPVRVLIAFLAFGGQALDMATEKLEQLSRIERGEAPLPARPTPLQPAAAAAGSSAAEESDSDLQFEDEAAAEAEAAAEQDPVALGKRIREFLTAVSDVLSLFNVLLRASSAALSVVSVRTRLAALVAHVPYVLGGQFVARVRVRNPQKYGFRPAVMLASSFRVAAAAAAASEDFAAELASAPDFDSATFHAMLAKPGVRAELGAEDLDGAERLAAAAAAAAAAATAGDIFDDAPDEFFDPITCAPMSKPVRLPTGDVIDRETLDRAVLENGPVNPFTQLPLDLSECKPAEDLAKRIEEWRATH